MGESARADGYVTASAHAAPNAPHSCHTCLSVSRRAPHQEPLAKGQIDERHGRREGGGGDLPAHMCGPAGQPQVSQARLGREGAAQQRMLKAVSGRSARST